MERFCARGTKEKIVQETEQITLLNAVVMNAITCFAVRVFCLQSYVNHAQTPNVHGQRNRQKTAGRKLKVVLCAGFAG